MQAPPIQFEFPPSNEPVEPPLPRMKWVWVLFITFFALFVPAALQISDSRPGLLQDSKTMTEKTVELKLSTKSLPNVQNQTSRPLFEDEIDGLLEKSKTDPWAQKLRAVLRREDNQKPFQDDLTKLSKSANPKNQAFARLLSLPKPSKDESMNLLKQLDGKELSEKVAAVEVKESFGDRNVRSATFKPETAIKLGFFTMLALGGTVLGTIAWVTYFVHRQNGRFPPRGFPVGNVDWAKADRLIFVALVILCTYLISGETIPRLFRGERFELLVFVPNFIVIAICLRVPIFGWRILPETVGLSLKEFSSNLKWAVSAFFANIPIMFGLLAVTEVLAKFLPGGAHPVAEDLMKHPSVWTIANLAFIACVIAPMWEEFVFRGMLFPALTKALGRPIYGALLSSFLFASIHPQGALGIVPLMGVAMMLCAVTYQTKSLVANIILHGLHNGATLVAALLLGPLIG